MMWTLSKIRLMYLILHLLASSVSVHANVRIIHPANSTFFRRGETVTLTIITCLPEHVNANVEVFINQQRIGEFESSHGVFEEAQAQVHQELRMPRAAFCLSSLPRWLVLSIGSIQDGEHVLIARVKGGLTRESAVQVQVGAGALSILLGDERHEHQRAVRLDRWGCLLLGASLRGRLATSCFSGFCLSPPSLLPLFSFIPLPPSSPSPLRPASSPSQAFTGHPTFSARNPLHLYVNERHHKTGSHTLRVCLL
eukprot:604055-Hanusia_phi.AAC.2